MIPHKLTDLEYVDRILVLDGGVIVADGTHDELMKESSLYQKRWSDYNNQNAPHLVNHQPPG